MNNNYIKHDYKNLFIAYYRNLFQKLFSSTFGTKQETKMIIKGEYYKLAIWA